MITDMACAWGDQPQCWHHRFDIRHGSGIMIEQSAVHGGKMQRRGATAAANDPRTTVARQSSILSGQFRCPGVLYLAIDKLWNPAIGLGNENVFVFGMGSHGEQYSHQVGCTHAAVGAKGC